MLKTIAGYDQRDPATVDLPVPDYTRALRAATSKLRVGVPRALFFENLDPEVAEALEAAIGVLRKISSGVTETTIPSAASILPILRAEAYAYHSKSISESPDRYQPFTRDRIIQSADDKAAAYAEALRQTNLIRREITKVFSSVDLLITPTTPAAADAFTQSTTFDPNRFRNTAPFDVFGLPTISVPCGFTRSGLPIGLQISGAPFAEPTVLALAHAYEQATEWHKSRPKLNPAQQRSATVVADAARHGECAEPGPRR